MQVLLVDDHPLVREVLAGTLRKALGEETVVHAVQDFEAALECAACNALDLVLLDLGLPGCTGIEALKRFREKHPDKKVVVVSANDERDAIQAAFRAGACGYIPKTSSADMVVAALKVVMAGGIYVPPEVLEPEQPASAAPRGLSDRQQEVLGLLLKGHSNNQIAKHLRMAENTVKHHVSAIYGVLGATSRAEAMATALRRGFKPSR
jgi:DNA-binding NarL/FixJ family response regulator